MHKFSRIIFISIVTLFFSVSALAQDTGGVKGKVRTSRGEGIAGVTITVRQKEKEVKTVTTDSDGEFQIDGLTSGNYNVVFEKSGFASGTIYNVQVKKKSVRDLGSKLILSVDRGTQVIVNASVFFKDGTSVFGAKVEIEKVNSDGSTRKVGSGYTGESGEINFRFPEGAARFRVTATAKGESASKEIEVDSAAAYRLSIILNLERPKEN